MPITNFLLVLILWILSIAIYRQISKKKAKNVYFKEDLSSSNTKEAEKTYNIGYFVASSHCQNSISFDQFGTKKRISFEFSPITLLGLRDAREMSLYIVGQNGFERVTYLGYIRDSEIELRLNLDEYESLKQIVTDPINNSFGYIYIEFSYESLNTGRGEEILGVTEIKSISFIKLEDIKRTIFFAHLIKARTDPENKKIQAVERAIDRYTEAYKEP